MPRPPSRPLLPGRARAPERPDQAAKPFPATRPEAYHPATAWFDGEPSDPRLLTLLDPSSLGPLADWFTAVGSRVRDAWEQHQVAVQVRDQKRAERRARHDAARLVATYMIASGQTFEVASRTVANQTGIPESVLAQLVPLVRHLVERAWRARRNRWIMQKVALGWTDAEIGQACAEHWGRPLHPKAVNRIVRAEREGARDLDAEAPTRIDTLFR